MPYKKRTYTQSTTVFRHLKDLAQGKPSTCTHPDFALLPVFEEIAKELHWHPNYTLLNKCMQGVHWNPNRRDLREWLCTHHPELGYEPPAPRVTTDPSAPPKFLYKDRTTRWKPFRWLYEHLHHGVQPPPTILTLFPPGFDRPEVAALKSNHPKLRKWFETGVLPEARVRDGNNVTTRTKARQLNDFLLGRPHRGRPVVLSPTLLASLPPDWKTVVRPMLGSPKHIGHWLETGEVITAKKVPRTSAAASGAHNQSPLHVVTRKRVKSTPTDANTTTGSTAGAGTKHKEPTVLDPGTLKAKKTKNQRSVYLTNEFLLKELELSRAQGRMTNNLGRAFMLLAEKCSYHPWYKGYSFREDMESNALVHLCQQWPKFDPARSDNPFAFFSQCCFQDMKNTRNREHDQSKIREAVKQDLGGLGSFNTQIDQHEKSGEHL